MLHFQIEPSSQVPHPLEHTPATGETKTLTSPLTTHMSMQGTILIKTKRMWEEANKGLVSWCGYKPHTQVWLPTCWCIYLQLRKRWSHWLELAPCAHHPHLPSALWEEGKCQLTSPPSSPHPHPSFPPPHPLGSF